MLRSISLSHIWSRDGTWTMDGCEIDIETYRHWDLIGVPIVHISGDLPMSIFACATLAAWAWRSLRPVFQLTHVHDLSTHVLDNRAKKISNRILGNHLSPLMHPWCVCSSPIHAEFDLLCSGEACHHLWAIVSHVHLLISCPFRYALQKLIREIQQFRAT